MANEPTHTMVMTVPEGLSKAQINTLKKKFKTSLIESLGGTGVAPQLRIRIIIIVSE